MSPANGQPRILLVDDEILVLRLFKQLLEDNGYLVVASITARTAAQSLASGRFDLVILDLGLPDMDGFDLLSLVRTQAPGVKVIVMSGYLSRTVSELATHFGAAASFEKPVTPTVFLQAVRNLLAT